VQVIFFRKIILTSSRREIGMSKNLLGHIPQIAIYMYVYIYIMYLYIYIEREAGCKGFFLQFQTNPIDIPLYPQDWFGYPSVRSHTTAHCSRENTMGAPSL
jgi:hypothetical protein